MIKTHRADGKEGLRSWQFWGYDSGVQVGEEIVIFKILQFYSRHIMSREKEKSRLSEGRRCRNITPLDFLDLVLFRRELITLPFQDIFSFQSRTNRRWLKDAR